MGKKEDNQPPSLFDNLDMFAAKPAEKKTEAKVGKSGEADSRPLLKKEKSSSKRSGQETASPFFSTFSSAGFAANMSRLSNRLGGCSSFLPIEL